MQHEARVAASSNQMDQPGTAGGWRCVAASVRGTGHDRTGQPCQDAHEWRLIGAQLLTAAVADGAGSAALSEVGARIAASSAVDSICKALVAQLPDSDRDWEHALKAAAQAARSAVEAEAERREMGVRELASTLILAAATPTGVFVVQVGDGAAVVRDIGGSLISITTPQNGEYLNETIFLTSPSAMETAQVAIWRGEPTHFALFSDGLQTIALTSREDAPYAPFFEPLFRFASGVMDQCSAEAELADFLRSPRFEQRTDDDLTLVLATVVNVE